VIRYNIDGIKDGPMEGLNDGCNDGSKVGHTDGLEVAQIVEIIIGISVTASLWFDGCIEGLI
jgi:hypothetical protein